MTESDVRLAMITSRNDTLVLFQGVWRPIEKIPAEYHAYAQSIARPCTDFLTQKPEAQEQQKEESPSFQEEKPEPLNKIEEIPEKVYTESPALEAVDPTGTLVEQVCFGCGYKAVLPYRASCPTCRNPYPVSMLLCVTWPELLRMAKQKPLVKAEPVVLKQKPGQLSLFGGAA